MDSQGNTASVSRRARVSAIARARFGLMTMLLSFLVLAAGAAQASPPVADYYLQRSKGDFGIVRTHYQFGRNYAQIGNYPLARVYFINAYSSSYALQSDVNRLYLENLVNLHSGMYRNVVYQQIAVQQSNTLKAQTQLLSAYLNILAQQPSNVGMWVNVDAMVVQISATLYYTEYYMRLAQL